jgi:heme o synthase
VSDTIRAYYQLTKPGVLYGNVLTAVAGFFLAAAGKVEWTLFFGMLVGMTLVIAAACVLNNYLDQDIDAIMSRTKKRPSVIGAVSNRAMVIYAMTLLIIGSAVLWRWTNIMTLVIGLLGFVIYVWLYGALSKRRSIHGTLVGSISGAMPILGGYTAASNMVDAGAVIAFLILFFWQFPEFYSIAIYRKKEYAAAKIPVMPVVKGVQSTIIQIFLYTILYVASTLALTLYGYVGFTYAVIMAVSGVYWIWLAWQGFHTRDADAWARRMFRFSMMAILLLCVMLSIGPLLP